MPTEEELEQHINNMLDDRELERIRAAIRKLDTERLNEISKKGGAED